MMDTHSGTRRHEARRLGKAKEFEAPRGHAVRSFDLTVAVKSESKES